ncbi:DUF4810 domain-containing protein [Campylobacter sp. 9BO]|uniref:DUF4810 domain-containing protein n=1 Tax=Campylobacter sp. 9BO TaxID=3424759 RepID=UPI003D335FFE
MIYKKALLVASVVVVFAGCSTSSTPPLYHWDGSYSSSLYSYLNDEYSPQEQISMLEKSVQDAYTKNAKVPPGLYAHLGLLYSNLGNTKQMQGYFSKEVELYPEAKNYIEFLLTQNKTKKVEK